MPRLVRRKPLWERITTNLNPMDFLLWLSEEMETRDWDSKVAGTNMGLALNFIFLLARANSGSSPSRSDDIFNDETSSGWISWVIFPVVWGLVAFSMTNAVYTLSRSRKYRLFEADIDVKPSTPSVRRVKVNSDTSSPSVLRYIADAVSPESADSRAHPDKARDVWELSVWDPLPVCLQLFCLFGPGHVLVYLIFLPLASLDARPSVTVFNTLLLQVTISGLLLTMTSQFAQQAKDHAIVEKEVMHEYDTKFVHPRLHPVVRDVGTQCSDKQPKGSRAFVTTGTPTTLIRRAYQTHPNPNYADSAAYEDRESSTPMQGDPSRSHLFTPSVSSPSLVPRRSDSATPGLHERSSALRKSLPVGYTPVSMTNAAASTPSHASVNHNTGGFMGIYSDSKSPLKKTISMNDMASPMPRNSREMAAYEQSGWGRPRSPTKSPAKSPDTRRSTGAMPDLGANAFASTARNRAQQRERYPSWR